MRQRLALFRVVTGYAFLCLATPTIPNKPEPNSQTDAGMGTAVTRTNEVDDPPVFPKMVSPSPEIPSARSR